MKKVKQQNNCIVVSVVMNSLLTAAAILKNNTLGNNRFGTNFITVIEASLLGNCFHTEYNIANSRTTYTLRVYI